MCSKKITGHSTRLTAGFFLIAGLASGVSAQSTVAKTQTVQWSSGINQPVRALDASALNQTMQTLTKRAGQSHVIVHFNHPLSVDEKQALAQSGLRLQSSLGGTSFFATLDAQADTGSLSRSALMSIDSINVANKQHKDLLGGIIHPWMLSRDEIDKEPQLKAFVDSGLMTRDELVAHNLDPLVAVIVMFHKDMNFKIESSRLSREIGAQIASEIGSINSVVLHLRVSSLDALVADDSVMWVEPPLPPMSDLNASNRALVGADTLITAPYSLDGSGVDVLIYDGGRMADHQDFGARLTVGASDTAGVSDHATHVGGTVGGGGTANPTHRGMAPAVNLISYGFEQDGGIAQGFLYTDPGDLEADYAEAISLYGADISNNSIGTNTAPNGFPCDWTGNYGVTAALIDAITRGSLGDPFRMVWANGNERQSSRCVGDDNGNFGEYFSTAPPAGAKNHITVGSVDSDTDLTSSFSSWGPVDDGRIKPDISAPGCQIGGDGGVTSTSASGSSSYSTKCGTSMASPTVTGISALILQQYRITFPDRNDLMNATLKSILANTAIDRGNIGPDYQYGFGSIRGIEAVDAVIAENVIEGDVVQGGVFRFMVIVSPGESELKVTMAWDDVPGTPNVDPVLINDLDLRIVGPGGGVFLPWTLNPADPGSPAVQNVRDGINNIEQVAINNPAAGVYTVEVTGFNVAVGGAQTFGATATSTIINCTSTGVVAFNAARVQCSGIPTVRVVDCDLNTSDTVLDMVNVLITSDSDPAGFILTLSELDPASASFEADFQFADFNGADLLVAEGDTITVSYLDADDGNGSTNVTVLATMVVDCTPPQTIQVVATNIEPRAVDIGIQIDEPASATVYYGTSIGALNDAAGSGALSTSHVVKLSGLVDNTSYFYAVELADQAGNISYNDNAGTGFTFTTPDIPDFFTDEISSFSMVGSRILFTPIAGVEGYQACLTQLDGGVLPFDPTIGTVVSLSDDDSELVSIADGKSVLMYGQSFGSFFVGSNGYITFGSADTDFSETIQEHFSEVRIAGRYDDLNPSDSGTVRYQQLDDRMVVSWDRVTEYNAGNDNTFQIEMFFTGEIAISWETLQGGNDGIIGLSRGTGVDPDFVESDLTGYLECMDESCIADLTGDGVLNLQDVFAFLSEFNNQTKLGDFDNNGIYNLQDVFAYLAVFNAGCL
ncbi:MAG: S8 family serine peptidase [Phycisphaerales bacterium]|nr:S8 family serine peptidase [Phycisphaerales bacterium]